MENEEILTTLITLGDWIRYAASRFAEAELFFGHGYDSAWDEAVQLTLTRLHLPPNLTPSLISSRLLLKERKMLLDTIEQRINTRKPLAYILREAWFCGLSFYVDERVLIPRSPIGELIEKQFAPWLEPENINNILDMGTGSGCIAIAAAIAFPQAFVDAVDLHEKALAVAEINISHYGLEHRVHLIQSDCFASLSPQKYDLIISNPPYVSAEELASLPPEYQYEPHEALYADIEGMAIVAKILNQALDYLTKEGVLVVEVGYSKEAMMNYFPDLPLTWLEFENGGEGVFLLTARQLQDYTEFKNTVN